MAHIAVKGELRNHEHRAANFGDRQIHLALRISKDAQSNRLFNQVFRVGARIGRANADEHEQSEFDLARGLTVNRNSGAAYALHHGPHLATGLAQERIMTGERLPASIAVRENVGEADAGQHLASRVDQCGQSPRKTTVALDVCAHFREMVDSRLPVRDVLEHLIASVQRAVDINFFEFVGHHASDSASVLAGKRSSPILFEFDERALGLRLISWTVRAKCRHGDAQGKNKQRGNFHVPIVT